MVHLEPLCSCFKIILHHIAIGVETLKIDSGCSLEKEFTELIRMNP